MNIRGLKDSARSDTRAHVASVRSTAARPRSGQRKPSKFQAKARGLFCFGGRGKQGPIIRFQKLEPMGDVVRMMVEMRERQAEVGAQDRRGQFRYQFLGRIGVASEPVLEVSPGRKSCPVQCESSCASAA